MQSMTLEQLRTTFHAGGLTVARVAAAGKRVHVVVDTKEVALARTPRPANRHSKGKLVVVP